MRLMTFVIVAFVLIAVEKSLLDVITLHALSDLRPTLMPILVVFVSLFAPRQTALWVAWCLGLTMDLVFGVPEATGSLLYVIGPHALGYTAGAYAVLQLRPMVFRRHVITLSLLTLAAVIIAGIVMTAVLTIRARYPGADAPAEHVTGASRLFMTTGTALYSALVAVPLGMLLYGSLPAWGFYHAGPRSANSR